MFILKFMITNKMRSFQVLLNALSLYSATDLIEHLVMQEMIQKKQFEELLHYLLDKMTTIFDLLMDEKEDNELAIEMHNYYNKSKTMRDYLTYYFRNGLDGLIIQD